MRLVRGQIKSGASGFTLIEVLFATLAFSIVLAAINTVFYTGVRLRERVAEKEAIFKPRMRALEMLKQDLRGTFYSEGMRADQFLCEPSNGLSVAGDRIQFFTSTGPTREEAKWSNIQMVEYYLAPSIDPRKTPDTIDLVRAVTRNILTSTYQAPVEQRLVSGLSSFGLTFYDGEIWQETWDSELQDPVLPKAVQITLQFNSEREQQGQLPPTLTQMVAILAEPRLLEDEEDDTTETTDDRDDEDNDSNTGAAPTGGQTGGGNTGGGGGTAGQGGRN